MLGTGELRCQTGEERVIKVCEGGQGTGKVRIKDKEVRYRCAGVKGR